MRAFSSSRDLVTQVIILLFLVFVAQDLVRVVDGLEFVLVHATGSVWVVLVAELVVHVFYVFVCRLLRQAQLFVVILLGVKIRRWLLFASPESPG